MAIPLPQGNGMDAFNKALGFDNFMKQMLERNKAIEQIAQHKENYGQKENHFLQNLALHKEQLAHSRANEGYNRRVAEARLAHYKKLDDPLSIAQDYAALKNWYKSRGQNTGVAGGQQTPMPHEQMGEGMGMYSPEGLQEAQQAPQMPGGGQMGAGNASGLSNEDLELMRNNPELRGWFKQKYKFDPLVGLPETPDQKRKAEEESAVRKEQNTFDVKKKNALQEELPQAEKLINNIEEAKKLINENKNLFGPGVGGLNFLGGPSQRKRNLKTKKEREAWGKIEDLFGTLVGKKATDFSHKGLKVAFDLATNTKPSFEEWPETAISKLNQMLKGLKEGHGRDLQWYKEHGGKIESKTRLKFNPVTGRLE